MFSGWLVRSFFRFSVRLLFIYNFSKKTRINLFVVYIMVYATKEQRNQKDRERRLKSKNKQLQPIKLSKPKPSEHEDTYSDSEPENIPESIVKSVPQFVFYH